jgi:tRNA(His) 5'-end guanylyltransferase
LVNKLGKCCFDCRVFQLENIEEVNKYLQWRRVDAIRNSKNSFCRLFMSHKEMKDKSSKECVESVKDKYDWYTLPTMIKRGVFVLNPNTHFQFDFNEDDDLTKLFISNVTFS